MKNDRRKKMFWRRTTPFPWHDIVKTKPTMLSPGQRFESKSDVNRESARSECVLRDAGAARHLCQSLAECRASDYNCEQTYCPRCARRFRRWLIGELLRIESKTSKSIQIMTVLLHASSDIRDLDVAPFGHSLRKRLDRAGLKDTSVIGGFEMVWRADRKQWVLHVNLMILGALPDGLTAFKNSYANSELDRPTKSVPLQNAVEQLSYLLKFTTYHRPFQQVGSRCSQAKPLNAKEHVALIRWMDQYTFGDMLFLYGVRREGAVLKPT